MREYGVSNLIRDLQTKPPLSRQAVCSWVAGRTQPDPDHALKMVDLGGGALSLEIIYAHQSKVVTMELINGL